MWCRSCQQDVPVIRSAGSAAACPRCRAELRPAADAGLELQAFDHAAAPATTAVRPPLAWDASAAELRRIGRKLRPCVRPDVNCQRDLSAPMPRVDAPPAVEPPPFEPVAPRPFQATLAPTDRALRGGAASVAADAGFLVMVAGAAAMAGVSEGLIIADYWRWGVFGCGIGGVVFAVGVLRLATRAWRECRELEAEVDELRERVGALATSKEPRRRPSMVAADADVESRRETVSSRVA